MKDETEIQLVGTSGPPAMVLRTIDETIQAARARLKHRFAQNTADAYRSDLRVYARWCSARGVEPFPASPQALVLYMTDLADGVIQAGRAHQWGKPRTAATVKHHLAAISTYHRQQYEDVSPTSHRMVRESWISLSHERGLAPMPKKAIVLDLLRRIVQPLGSGTAHDIRDLAIILVGFWSAMRRSELMSIHFDHLRQDVDGIRIYIPRSKGDQKGEGRWTGIVRTHDKILCPVTALGAWTHWLSNQGIRSGHVFRSLATQSWLEPASGEVVINAVKGAVEAAGIDSGEFGAHSLRSGFVTTAGMSGVPLPKIAGKTGHARLDTLRRYLQAVDGMENDAGWGLA